MVVVSVECTDAEVGAEGGGAQHTALVVEVQYLLGRTVVLCA